MQSAKLSNPIMQAVQANASYQKIMVGVIIPWVDAKR